MKRLVFIATLATLVAAPSVQAKGVVSATVCGADACREVDEGREIQLFTESQGPTGPPASASGWYRARLAIGAPGEPAQERITVAVLPDQRLMRGPGLTWNPINEDAARTFAAAADGLEPLPPSDLGIRPAAAPRPVARDEGGGVPWGLVAAAIAVALAAVALTPPVRRRLTERLA
jgi:hypothetical protein